MELLSPEWCDELVARCGSLPPVLDDVTVGVQITGAPRGRGRVRVEVADGRIVSCVAERDPDARVELKTSWDDVAAMLTGTLDPNVAFMTGDLKTDGPTGPLLAMLAAWRRPDVAAVRAELTALVD